MAQLCRRPRSRTATLAHKALIPSGTPTSRSQVRIAVIDGRMVRTERKGRYVVAIPSKYEDFWLTLDVFRWHWVAVDYAAQFGDSTIIDMRRRCTA